MNGHWIPGLILLFSNGWETHCCRRLSTNLRSILNMTRTTMKDLFLPEQDRNDKALTGATSPHKVVLLWPHCVQLHQLKWWLTKYSVNHVDIFHMYAEMSNDECTEMQLTFQDSQNPSVFVTTPWLVGTGLYLTAANHAVIMQKFSVFNEQQQEFAQVVRVGYNSIQLTCLLNMGPGGYDNCASDLHLHSRVVQERVLHGLLCQPNVTTQRIYQILESCEDHTIWLTENGDTLQSDTPSS